MWLCTSAAVAVAVLSFCTRIAVQRSTRLPAAAGLELTSLTVALAYNLKQGYPVTSWWELVPALTCVVWEIGHKGTKVAGFLILNASMLSFLLKGIVPVWVVELLYSLNLFVVLAPRVWLVYHYHLRDEIPAIGDRTLTAMVVLGLLRLMTTALETRDWLIALITFAATAGNAALLAQLVIYRRRHCRRLFTPGTVWSEEGF